MYKFIYVFCMVFMFIACSNDDKNLNTKQEVIEDVIQIEQSDAKTQVSDTNLPLPVDETVQNNFDFFNNCLSCHNQNYFDNISKNMFVSKIKEFQKNQKSKEHILNDEQINLIVENLYQGK